METIEKQLASLLTAQSGQQVNQDEVAAFAAKLGQVLGTPGQPGQESDSTKTEPA